MDQAAEDITAAELSGDQRLLWGAETLVHHAATL
jgi:hypothetical protein